jgi:hypothetical protein
MATATAIAIRRDAALQRLTSAIKSLAGDEVAEFTPPKQAELREAALIEWAADALEGSGGEPAQVEVAPDQMPKWYQALRDKASEDGVSIRPLYQGETKATWTEAAESAGAEVDPDVEADAEADGVTLDTAETSDGETVVVTEDVAD